QAMVYNLGSTPVVGTYKVLNNQLVYTDNLGDAGTIPLTDHVVSLQAAYGFDTRPQPSSLVVNTWSETLVDADGSTTENAGDWLRVGAIKVAVVTRSPQKERARDANGVCTTTPSAPTLSWLPNSTISISLGTDNEWKCYRYQVFETTIALRNTIWRPQ
ncbi:MAG: PilW family protein, partial [Pseudomonadota bacterium]